jgi:hypothetical protein
MVTSEPNDPLAAEEREKLQRKQRSSEARSQMLGSDRYRKGKTQISLSGVSSSRKGNKTAKTAATRGEDLE